MYTHERKKLHERAVHVYSRANYVQQQNRVGKQIVQRQLLHAKTCKWGPTGVREQRFLLRCEYNGDKPLNQVLATAQIDAEEQFCTHILNQWRVLREDRAVLAYSKNMLCFAAQHGGKSRSPKDGDCMLNHASAIDKYMYYACPCCIAQM